MRVMTSQKQLNGKKIAFSHMSPFAEQITIVTTGKEVLMVSMETDDIDDEPKIIIHDEEEVLRRIEKNTYIRERLEEVGVIKIEALS